MSVSVETNTISTVSFYLFKQVFSYEVVGKIKKPKEKDLLPLLEREIYEVHFENRADDKNVLLFYKRAKLRSHLTFSFAVEIDSGLDLIVKSRKDSNDKIPEMLKYIFENKDKLNYPI